MASSEETVTPGYRAAYNINPKLVATNQLDIYGTPTGGQVKLEILNQRVLDILWQMGGRMTDGGILTDPNGVFVEDVLWAALQRLEFFNASKYRCRENSIAITKIEEALFILKDRQLSRTARGVEGKHEV